MKSKIIVCALIVLACPCLQARGGCDVDGKHIPVGGGYYENCIQKICFADQTMQWHPCKIRKCPEGKQIDYKEMDLSKDYPECCPRPICAP